MHDDKLAWKARNECNRIRCLLWCSLQEKKANIICLKGEGKPKPQPPCETDSNNIAEWRPWSPLNSAAKRLDMVGDDLPAIQRMNGNCQARNGVCATVIASLIVRLQQLYNTGLQPRLRRGQWPHMCRDASTKKLLLEQTKAMGWKKVVVTRKLWKTLYQHTRTHARARTHAHARARTRTHAHTHKHAQARTSTHKHTQAHTSTHKHTQALKHTSKHTRA